MCREIGVSAVSESSLGLISPRGIGFWVVFFLLSCCSLLL